ncbi:unnamed protein product [Mytilus edulis]|uniref:Uncharacterized protein n=1 Tax=Mytilus edulis TaxID=6550 RepID=A0A8S3S1S7_MYTED|nr:unnamed protein product [Mytilus edulis]
MVVMFEDCCKKVELHDRIFRLKEILAHKKLALKELEQQEKEIIDGFVHFPTHSIYDISLFCCRLLSVKVQQDSKVEQSMISTISAMAEIVTVLSILQLLAVEVHVPSTSKSLYEGDNSSSIGEDLNDSYISYVDSDADSGMCICCPNTDEHIALKNLKETVETTNLIRV